MTRPDVYSVGDPGDPTTFEVWDVKSGELIQDITSIGITLKAGAGTVATLRVGNVPVIVNVVPAPKAHKFTMVDVGKAVRGQDSSSCVEGNIAFISGSIADPGRMVVTIRDKQGLDWTFYDEYVGLLAPADSACVECKGTGTYTCALTAKESPCSLGCKPWPTRN